MAMTEAQIQALYQVTYPINFVANGDTVHDGFHKHIQEIERIYGLLGGLERSKVTTGDLVSTLANYVTKSEFNDHVNSTNPHPNLQLATLGGNLDVSRITGNWDLSRVTGQLAVGNINMAGLIAYLEGNTGFADWIKSIAGGGSGGSYLKQDGKKTMPVTISSKTMGNTSGDDATWHVLLSGSVTISIPQAYANTSYDAKVTLTASNTNFLLSPVISKTSGSSFTVTMPEGGGLGYNADITANKIIGPTTSSINVSWETEGTLAS